MTELEWIAIGTIIGVIALAIAVIKLYLERETSKQLRKLVESLSKVVYSYHNEVGQLRREIQTLRSETKDTKSAEERRIELERQKLAQRERQTEWQKIRDIAKGIGWILDRTE
ncbi:MAG: hypothetical protein JSW41_03900 [Candidatus Aenigmatarchaeota archaeon]|nr:MAG: hypothetical protein JSW41_03900 [Candidatus Aenigmarchaeota archaeon]